MLVKVGCFRNHCALKEGFLKPQKPLLYMPLHSSSYIGAYAKFNNCLGILDNVLTIWSWHKVKLSFSTSLVCQLYMDYGAGGSALLTW